MAREDRGDRRFARDEEDRRRSEEGLRAGSSRRRERDEPDDERDRHLQWRRPGGHDDETIRVPKKREEAHVERIPVEEGQAPEEIEVRDDEVLIPVTEEEIVVERREVVKEVLRVRKDVVEDEEVVGVDKARETGEHRGLDEHARGGSSARERHEAVGHEEGGGRVASSEETGTGMIGAASSIKPKRHYRVKTRGGEKKEERAGKTNRHGGGGNRTGVKASLR